MRRGSIGVLLALGCLAFAGSSCRSILGITPGKEGPDNGGGSGASGGTADGNGGTGLSDSGGTSQNTGGAAGKGSGGKGSGGTSSAGSSAIGGSNAEGGEAGAPPAALLPAGACADCFARDCPAELAACQADTACVSGVPAWLGCTEPDAGTCLTSDAGALHDFESCGVRSCELCQHLTDDTPSIEILSPSNGAQIVVDATQRFEATVRVHNFKVSAVGTCGTDHNCGHIHFNLDDEDSNNCRVNLWFNTYITIVDADNVADSFAQAGACKVPIYGKTVTFSASLSDNATHGDRIPPIKATVFVTLAQPPP